MMNKYFIEGREKQTSGNPKMVYRVACIGQDGGKYYYDGPESFFDALFSDDPQNLSEESARAICSELNSEYRKQMGWA